MPKKYQGTFIELPTDGEWLFNKVPQHVFSLATQPNNTDDSHLSC